MKPTRTDVTLLLNEISGGNQNAAAALVSLLYDELHEIAARYLQHERRDHTLQATALIHEAYLRLVDQQNVEWKNRSHFFGVAAQLMRRILVDYARSHQAIKRGGSVPKISLDDAIVFSKEQPENLVALDQLLTRLSAVDSQQGQIVELRFFAGLSVEETAEIMDISPATVKRDWAMAKVWLARELKAGDNRQSQATSARA